MFRNKIAVIGIAIFIAIISAGCQPTPEEPGAGEGTATATMGAIEVAQTQVAEQQAEATATALIQAALGTPTEVPLAEPTPTAAAMPEATAQPTTAPAPTSQPTPAPTQNVIYGGAPGTADELTAFTPTSDAAHGYAANDATVPSGMNLEVCWRYWQGADGNNTPWISIWCDPMAEGNVEVVLDYPTHYTLNSTNGGTLQFVLTRDLDAPADAYEMSLRNDWTNQSQSRLSYYFKGTASVMDAFGNWIDLEDCDFYQVPLQENWTGGWVFVIRFEDGEHMELWQGAQELSLCANCGVFLLHNPFFMPYILPSN